MWSLILPIIIQGICNTIDIKNSSIFKFNQMDRVYYKSKIMQPGYAPVQSGVAYIQICIGF
jgi:hypothetical protein